MARVVGSAKGGYSLYGQGEDTLGTFDAVVIAAPIGLAGISLDMRGEVNITVTPKCLPVPFIIVGEGLGQSWYRLDGVLFSESHLFAKL